MLELTNSWPSPITVKKRYKDIMNRIAQETGNNTSETKKFKEIYDCLMFS